MAKAPANPIAVKYLELVPLSDILPINGNLSSATENTMVSILGPPKLPQTTDCKNANASAIVAKNAVTDAVTKNFRLTGMKVAVDSVKAILSKTFAKFPDLEEVLGTEGMLCVIASRRQAHPAQR